MSKNWNRSQGFPKFISVPISIIFAAPIWCTASASLAQTLQSSQVPLSNSAQTPAPQDLAQAQDDAPRPQTEPLIPVKQIVVKGSTVFSETQLAELTAPLIDKSVTLAQLNELVNKINQLYQNNNYITSRATLPPDTDLSDGIVTIQVIEGQLENIKIERAGGEQGRLSENYIRDRIALGVGIPLNFARLEEELQLLRADPLIADIKASLAAGEKSGGSVIQVTFTEADTFHLDLQADNYGNPATGIYRGGITLQQTNLSGLGDTLFGNYIRSGSANTYAAGYQIPLNPRGGTLDFSTSLGQNPITEAGFETLNIKTDSQVYELTYRQPLIKNPRQEFALSLGAAIEVSNSFLDGRSFNFQNLLFDDGRSQSTVIRFGQDLISRDGGGAWAFRSTFNLGVEALGATIRNNAPDGRFFSWAGQVLRLQRLGSDRDTLALLRIGAQLTGDSLLPLNRYSVGGPQSVRGYRQNQLTGDSGIQASLEFQLPVVRNPEGVSLVKLLPFVEAGTVWNTAGSNPQPQTIVGTGLGLMWQPSTNITIRLDYGIALNRITSTNSNLQDSGLYFSVNTRL